MRVLRFAGCKPVKGEQQAIMEEADIRKYAGLMSELGLTGLEITEGNKSLRLERTAAVAKETMNVVTSGQPGTEREAAAEDYISVTSPIVGVFYSASAENANPYVSIGDKVEKGTVLCIIEAMKLMNEITSECSGTVLEICVTNGQMVEYGTELFRIKKNG